MSGLNQGAGVQGRLVTVQPKLELVERRAHRLGGQTHTDTKAVWGFEKAARNDRGFELIAQQLAQLVHVAGFQAREHDRSILRPEALEIVAAVEKLSKVLAILLEHSLRPRRNLIQFLKCPQAQ